ncbi:hypothetical protein SJA_C1-27020 [Sphingobium indicum UT26S]|uniref:Uncharacterized protein n=1 Tax=Sphingobium indicum (strain DSM 16413 / CCM 7287 / MTCC 6362 / UT26 / NBRC 101211 / UT26S) TaxID=452662 RepID=D4Z4K4_SPHIU|nr:hypothetical protein SJA_C1-27020 [Sphingobium indicum UT26S]
MGRGHAGRFQAERKGRRAYWRFRKIMTRLYRHSALTACKWLKRVACLASISVLPVLT